MQNTGNNKIQIRFAGGKLTVSHIFPTRMKGDAFSALIFIADTGDECLCTTLPMARTPISV